MIDTVYTIKYRKGFILETESEEGFIINFRILEVEADEIFGEVDHPHRSYNQTEIVLTHDFRQKNPDYYWHTACVKHKFYDTWDDAATKGLDYLGKSKVNLQKLLDKVEASLDHFMDGDDR